MKYIIGFFFLIGVLFGVATLFGWDKIWLRLFGPADMGAVEFEGLKKGDKPNQALICPEGLCNDDDRDRVSPVYSLQWEELKTKFLASLEKEQRLERVDDDSDPMQLRFVQRSKFFLFPDTIRVRFIQFSDETSTIAAYSQSQIGRSDLSVNKARLNRWLKRLQPYEKATENSG